MYNKESGRSMVEMLGVLAIIGVLSIGGIAGYTLAMDKYRANENLATGSQCVILAQSDNGGNGIQAGDNHAVNCATKYKLNLREDVRMSVSYDGDEYTLKVVDKQDVCDQMKNAFPDDDDARKPYKLDCGPSISGGSEQGGQQEPTPQEGNSEPEV